MSREAGNPFSGSSAAEIGLIGTLSVAFMQIAAPLASVCIKRYSPRIVLVASGIIYFVACLSASYGTKLWHFLLTQGFLLGIASCLSFITAVTVTPTWYSKRRGLAMGLITSGTGVGGLVWAPSIRAMNEQLGFRMALRINGCAAIVALFLSAAVLDWDEASKIRLKQDRTSGQRYLSGTLFGIPLVSLRAAKSKAFAAQAFGATLHGAAYYIPLFFYSSYAQTLDYSSATGANFIAINNACNAIGKVVIGFIADRYIGRINALVLTTSIGAITTASFWIPSTLLNGVGSSRGLFIAFSICYGTFASAYVSLFPASLVEIFGPAQYASVNGLLYMLRGFGGLAGTPVGGALIKGRTSGMPQAYWATATLTATFLTGAALSMVWVWFEAHKKRAETGQAGVRKWRI